MPLTAAEKKKLYNDFVIPLTNGVRKLERLSVQHAHQREIETAAECHHTTLNEFRKALKLPFRESDMEHSVYGENGNKGGGG